MNKNFSTFNITVLYSVVRHITDESYYITIYIFCQLSSFIFSTVFLFIFLAASIIVSKNILKIESFYEISATTIDYSDIFGYINS